MGLKFMLLVRPVEVLDLWSRDEEFEEFVFHLPVFSLLYIYSRKCDVVHIMLRCYVECS